MSDGRINNGNKGHSTISNGVDNRKNQYKEVLNDALTDDELTNVIRMLYSKAIDKEDTSAAKILLETYLGKPRQMVLNYEMEKVNIDPKRWV